MVAARPRRRWLARLALILFGLAVPLVVAEVGFRLHAWSADAATTLAYENLDRPEAKKLPRDRKVSLSHFMRRSKNPAILYEMLPNLSGLTFQGVPLATDSHGFREPERPLAKPPHGLRIVALGDSVMFGWGIDESQTVLRRLEAALRERLPDRQVDLINTSVPGYNTAMQVAVLEEKGLQFQPDIVMIDFCGNDVELPNLLPRTRDYWSLSHSFLVDFADRVLTGRRDPWHDKAFDHAPRAANSTRFERDPEKVPPQYAYMVGWDGWRRAMERLVELSKQHGFHVIVTTHWKVLDELRAGCKEMGLPLIAPEPRILEYMKEHGITLKDYVGSELTVSPTDPHPTALHHGLQLEVLWAELTKPGVLESLLVKRR
jgi:hypothetical protein